MSAIVINDLTKRMGKKKIFQNLNLEVLEGEFFALLGLDEAGKTTIARILFNYLKPAKGQVNIFDMDCAKDSKLIKESVSYIPEDVVFNENIKAISLLKSTLRLHNLQNTEEMERLIELFNFDSRLKLIDMDENEKKVFAVINALITKPRLIVIDEPSKGLTNEQIAILFNHLKELKATEGLTVFMLTNSLMDAQRYCDRAAYLFDGKIKDVEYLNDKVSNDKLIRIHKNIIDINPFTSIGAILLKKSPYETTFYFDKDMNMLSKVISQHMIDDYTIENSSLKEKIAAYYDTDNYKDVEVEYHKEMVQEENKIVIEKEVKNDDINKSTDGENVKENSSVENINFEDTVQIAPKGTKIENGDIISSKEDDILSENEVEK